MKVTIDGRDYPFPSDMTIRETLLVKDSPLRLLAGDMYAAAIIGDNAGVAAYCLVALRRAEPQTPATELVDRILDLPANRLTVDFAEQEADESPPADGAAEAGATNDAEN